MPRRLLDRCDVDSVREFRLAARKRFADASALAAAEQRTGAIYLWGYSAEMTLKAAYFSLIGFAETDPITWGAHLRPAINRGRTLGIVWPDQGQGHNIRAWAELVVRARPLTPAATAFAPEFVREVLRWGRCFNFLWSETLRYYKNHAYPHEVKQVHEAAEWLLVNSRKL